MIPLNGHRWLPGSTPTHWNAPFSNHLCRSSSPSSVFDDVVSTEVANNQPDTGKPFITPLHFVVAANVFRYAAPEQNQLDDRPELRPSNMLAKDIRNVVLRVDVYKVDHPIHATALQRQWYARRLWCFFKGNSGQEPLVTTDLLSPNMMAGPLMFAPK